MAGKLRRTLMLTCAAMAVWSLGYGPLLPWSPVRPGFAALQGQRVTLVYPERMALPQPLREPDRLLEEAEQFHRLRAESKITIFVCPDWSTAYRVLPRLAQKGIGAITLATGTAIYVLPRVAERGLDPVEFVRHELSHAVLHQNQNMRQAVRLVEVQWLAEGIAVWFGRQQAYLSGDEFRRVAPSRDLAAYIDPALRERLADPFDIRFAYVCWRRFNEFLSEPDPERYWAFVHAAIVAPREWRSLFERHFHRSFKDAISAFALQVKQQAEAARPSPAEPPSAPHTPHSQLPRQRPR